MNVPPPRHFNGSPVVCWSAIDERHQVTEKCSHFNALTGESLPVPAFIAIVGVDDSYYLFRFDREWSFLTDTWHETLDEARGQAEFEYAGVSATWQTFND